MNRIKITSTIIAIGFIILLSTTVKSDTTPIRSDVNQIAKNTPGNSIENRVLDLEKKVKLLETRLSQMEKLSGQQKDEDTDKQTALQKELKERKRQHQVDLAEQQKEIDLKLKTKKVQDTQDIEKAAAQKKIYQR